MESCGNNLLLVGTYMQISVSFTRFYPGCGHAKIVVPPPSLSMLI